MDIIGSVTITCSVTPRVWIPTKRIRYVSHSPTKLRAPCTPSGVQRGFHLVKQASAVDISTRLHGQRSWSSFKEGEIGIAPSWTLPQSPKGLFPVSQPAIPHLEGPAQNKANDTVAGYLACFAACRAQTSRRQRLLRHYRPRNAVIHLCGHRVCGGHDRV